MKISVVVATYKRPRCLKRCLESLRAQQRAADEVIVVCQGDDGESPAVVRDVGRHFDGATGWVGLQIDEANIAKAENAGVARARGEVVAFIDDDATAAPSWLRLMEQWYGDPRVGGVGGPYIEQPGGRDCVEYANTVGTFKWYGRYVSRQWCLTDGPKWVDVLSGSNMSFRRHLIPPIPDTILPYWNAFEVYWAGAVRRRGFKLIFDPALAVDHFREGRRCYYSFEYRSEKALRRVLFHNHAHNFVYAVLVNSPTIKKLAFLLYEFLVGDSGRPGLVRAAVSVLEGRGGEVAEGLGPSLKGRLAGVRTYLEDKCRIRKRSETRRSRLSTRARVTEKRGYGRSEENRP